MKIWLLIIVFANYNGPLSMVMFPNEKTCEAGKKKMVEADEFVKLEGNRYKCISVTPEELQLLTGEEK